MTARQFCSVLVAAMGIYLIASSIQMLLFALEMQLAYPSDGPLEVSQASLGLVSSLGSAFIGTALVLGRNRIAVVIAPDDDAPAQGASSITASALMAVGLALLGVWLTATGAADLTPYLTDNDLEFRDAVVQANGVSALVRMAFGGVAFWLGYRQVRALDDCYDDVLYEDEGAEPALE